MQLQHTATQQHNATHCNCDQLYIYTYMRILTKWECDFWEFSNENATGLLHHKNYRSLLQNIVSFIGLFCKRDQFSPNENATALLHHIYVSTGLLHHIYTHIYTYIYIYIYILDFLDTTHYWVAPSSRLLKITGLFCKRAL